MSKHKTIAVIYQLAIITPCFNPVGNWTEKYINSCKNIEKILKGVEIVWVLVNDGSVQNVEQTHIEQIQDSVANFSYQSYALNKGKGFATRCGVKASNAAHIIYTDIDFPYKDEDLANVYQSLLAGNDLVIAKRGSQYYQHISKRRTWISQKFKSLVKVLFRIPTTDTQAGLKGLSTNASQVLLQTKVDRYLFDLELVKMSARSGLKIVEIPVELKDGVVLTDVSYKILFTEFINLVKIFFK